MARMVLLALLIGTAAPVLAGTTDDAKLRDERNWDVILSQYPQRALDAGEQGPVGFKVTLDRDGYATTCDITQSSGYPRLDAETCELMLNRAVFKGVRDANGRKVSSVHDGLLNWRLPGTMAGAAAPARVQVAQDDSDKKVCRRKLRTGSLADFERICFTKAEWRRLGENTRDEWGELQGAKGSTHGN